MLSSNLRDTSTGSLIGKEQTKGQKENLSRALDWNLISYFWFRLECMWYSKPIMKGIIAMRSYSSSEQGGAVINKGIGEMVKTNGEHMFKILTEHGRWKPREDQIGFVLALNEYLNQIFHLEVSYHYTRLILPTIEENLMICSQCGREKENYYEYHLVHFGPLE